MKLITEANGAPSVAYSGSTLIIPAVTIGNVGQLAVDLIIETVSATRLGFLLDDSLLPSVGVASSNAGDLTLGLELYALPSLPVFILQQRAPVAAGLQAQFSAALSGWIKEAGFSKVWILGGLDATFRKDAQLASGQPLRLWSPSSSNSSAIISELSSNIPLLEETWFEDKSPENRLLPPWSLSNALNKQGVPTASLLCFVSEGDNRREGILLADALKTVVNDVGTGVADRQWKQPSTWEFVFGVRTSTYVL